MSIILLITSFICFFIAWVFLMLSFGAYLLNDWKRDADVKHIMVMRLAFSMAFILIAIFMDAQI